MVNNQKRFEIGVDEAGRGPLAGPVAVGVVCVARDFDWGLLLGVTDSKKLSEKRREEIYKEAKKLEKAGLLQSVVVMGSAKQIDKKGIAVVIREGIIKSLQKLLPLTKGRPSLINRTNERRSPLGQFDLGVVKIKLDGGLRAPAEWVNQETIIKGDAKEKVIGLASIMAKVTRDRYMRRVATRPAYTPYDFATHKGYGTVAHRNAIAKNGISPEHRKTFCRNIKSVV